MRASYDGINASDNPDEAAFFSSYGCVDGRIKPDVVAPGTFIASTLSKASLEVVRPYPGSENYQFMSGTSMSTPITAGTVAVIREYIQKNYGITNPSAALIKALVINGALTEGYSAQKGWGKISLYDSIFSTKVIDEQTSLSSSQVKTYSTQCKVTKIDNPLKITLVWSDYPAAVNSEKALVNDLDLKVTSPDGNVVFYGNDFTSPYNSDFDRVNNVENVIINNPMAGTYKIEVIGHNVQHGPQPFALVYSADFFSAPKNLTASSSQDSITVSWNPVPGATSYDIEIDGATTVNVNATSYTHNNLAYNTEHTYRVRAKTSQKTGDWSYTLTMKTILDTPYIQSTNSEDGIELSWNPVLEATFYDIYVDGKFEETISTNSYLFTKTLPNTNYKFSIKARTDFNTSEFSNTIEIYSPDLGLAYKSPMKEPRMDFGAIASSNGKIYVMGGKMGPIYLDTIEEYNPLTNNWDNNKAPMSMRKIGFGAAEAANGKLYVLGGSNNVDSYLNTVEEYDPVNNNWTTKNSMPTARTELGVVFLNGKIYAIGGYNGTALNKVEIYDPATDTWTTGSPMPSKRSNFGICTFNGKIYVMGGICGTESLDAVEVYDPATDKWTIMKAMNVKNSDFALSELNGKLYLSGGKNSNMIFEYDPETCLMAEKAELPIAIWGNASVVQNDKLYILGGYGDYLFHNKVMTYNPDKDGWFKKSFMNQEKAFFAAAELNGKIYTLGGCNRSYTAIDTVEEYDIQNDVWTYGTSMSSKRKNPSCAVANGKIYVFGGDSGNIGVPYLDVTEEYDPVNKVWIPKSPMPEGRHKPKSVYLDGYIYVFGGETKKDINGDGKYEMVFADTILRYDPVNDRWDTLGSMVSDKYNYSVEAVNGKIYILGGQILITTSQGIEPVPSNTIEEFDPKTGTWTSKTPMPNATAQCGTAVVNDKIYLIGGAIDDYSDGRNVQVYDPLTDTWTSKTDLPFAIARHSAVYSNGKLYSMGGLSASTLEVLPDVYSYTISPDEIIKVTAGSTVMEPRGGIKRIPVTISNVPDKGIYSADISLNFDPSKLSLGSITPGNAVPSNVQFNYQLDNTAGTLNVHILGNMETEALLKTDGVLMNIDVDVLDSVNSIGSSDLSFIKSQCNLFNTPSNPYNGTEFSKGSVDIFIYGDVNGTSTVTSDDATLVRNWSLNTLLCFPSSYGRLAADVDGNGVVNAGDQTLITRYINGYINKFPIQQ